VVFYDPDGVPLWHCTGARVALTVLLTAGHCAGFDPTLSLATAHAQVWFDPEPIALDPAWSPCQPCRGLKGYLCGDGFKGTPQAYSDWIGLLTLPQPRNMAWRPSGTLLPTTATLGRYGRLTTRRDQQTVTFTVVSYGLQLVNPVKEDASDSAGWGQSA
jgi:hypothetical protein